MYYTEPNVLDNIIHTDEVEEENYEDYDQEYTIAYSLHQNTVFELLEPGTFVGLRSPPNAIEPFFIAQYKCHWTIFHCSNPFKRFGRKKHNEFGHSALAGKMYGEVVDTFTKIVRKKKIGQIRKAKKTPNCFHSYLQNVCDKHLFIWRFNSKLWRVLLSFQSCSLKLVSAIFYQTYTFSSNDSPLKTMKNAFYFIKKLFSFSRYSNFCNFFPSFLQFQIQKDLGLMMSSIGLYKVAAVIFAISQKLLYITSTNLVR